MRKKRNTRLFTSVQYLNLVLIAVILLAFAFFVNRRLDLIDDEISELHNRFDRQHYCFEMMAEELDRLSVIFGPTSEL